jgi:hypothetical protein
MANLRHPETPATFKNIHALVPDMDSTPKRVFDRTKRPRIIKSHYCFSPEFPTVIYVVRDPRDVVLSQHHFQRKRQVIEDNYPLDRYLDRFLAGQTCIYGSWQNNVATWLCTRTNHRRFLLVRYEDLIADTPGELKKIAAFLSIEADQERIAQAVERSSARNMKKLEQTQSEFSPLTRSPRKDLAFMRSAKSGGWRSELPESLVAKIELEWAPLMRYLGYELTTRVGENHEAEEVFPGITKLAR